jgi:hypothetical protein
MRRTAAVAALLAFAAIDAIGAQQKLNIGHAAAPDVSFRLDGDFAKVRIIGWSRDSVSIMGYAPKGTRFQSHFGDGPNDRSTGAKAYLVPDEKGPVVPGSTIELRVPVGARVWLKAGSADVECVGITGELDINVLGGSVRVNGSQRVLKVEAIDAAVVVDGSPAWVRLKTAEGDITMRGTSADAAFSTVTGNIVVSDGSLERARFESVSGGVTFAGELVRGAALNMDTHSGSIEVQLAGKPSVTIDATTNNGTIESQLSKNSPITGRDGRGQQITVSLGNVDSRITIRTSKGNIRLARR